MGTKGAYPFAAKEALYAAYTMSALWYAHDDAISARDLMRGLDESAEGWYADDASTICKEIRFRQGK